MGRLDKIEDWLIDHFVLVVTALLVILVVFFMVASVIDDHNEKDMWNDFADQVNRNTDYYLEKNTVGTCGYCKIIGSEYSMNLTVSSTATTTTYTRVYAKEGGLALEWHEITPSKWDIVTSTTYIPYESICYIQANKVV